MLSCIIDLHIKMSGGKTKLYYVILYNIYTIII
jgi:hypothetical protein